jgi:hypothetical protein
MDGSDAVLRARCRQWRNAPPSCRVVCGQAERVRKIGALSPSQVPAQASLI